MFASPLAKSIAREKGIDLRALGGGSGPEGRIVKADVLAAAARMCFSITSLLHTCEYNNTHNTHA